MPLSRKITLKYTAGPTFSGKKPESTAWTRDARYYAKGLGFLSAFVSNPPQYIPVGELDTEKPKTRYLSTGGTAAKVYIYMHWRGISCRQFSRVRATRAFCTGVPRRGKRATLSLHGTALKRREPNPTSPDALIVIRWHRGGTLLRKGAGSKILPQKCVQQE